MRRLEPPSNPHPESPMFFIGQDSRGNWVVQDQECHRGGLFADRSDAIRFVLFENGRQPQAVVMVPGVFEFDMNRKPSAAQQGETAQRRRRAA